MDGVGYIRVSTLDQATEGVSLDAQRAKIAAYCALHDLNLVEVVADEGISGKRADNRPGLQRALDLVCQRKGVLVTLALSRIARSTKDCIEIAERLDRHGANLASISEKIDTGSGMGRFFFRLMASLAELERDQVSERTKVAMSYLRRQGKRVSRFIPYGSGLAEDGVTLAPDQSEVEVVERIVRLRREERLSFAVIGRRLDAEGVPAKNGGRWHAKVVRDVAMRASVA